MWIRQNLFKYLLDKIITNPSIPHAIHINRPCKKKGSIPLDSGEGESPLMTSPPFYTSIDHLPMDYMSCIQMSSHSSLKPNIIGIEELLS